MAGPKIGMRKMLESKSAPSSGVQAACEGHGRMISAFTSDRHENWSYLSAERRDEPLDPPCASSESREEKKARDRGASQLRPRR